MLIDLSGSKPLPRISRRGDTGFLAVGFFHSNVNLQFPVTCHLMFFIDSYFTSFTFPSISSSSTFHDNPPIPLNRFFHPCGVMFRVMTGGWRSLLPGWSPSICRPFFLSSLSVSLTPFFLSFLPYFTQRIWNLHNPLLALLPSSPPTDPDLDNIFRCYLCRASHYTVSFPAHQNVSHEDCWYDKYFYDVYSKPWGSVNGTVLLWSNVCSSLFTARCWNYG